VLYRKKNKGCFEAHGSTINIVQERKFYWAGHNRLDGRNEKCIQNFYDDTSQKVTTLPLLCIREWAGDKDNGRNPRKPDTIDIVTVLLEPESSKYIVWEFSFDICCPCFCTIMDDVLRKSLLNLVANKCTFYFLVFVVLAHEVSAKYQDWWCSLVLRDEIMQMGNMSHSVFSSFNWHYA
jgi:hypothetical protein